MKAKGSPVVNQLVESLKKVNGLYVGTPQYISYEPEHEISAVWYVGEYRPEKAIYLQKYYNNLVRRAGSSNKHYNGISGERDYSFTKYDPVFWGCDIPLILEGGEFLRRRYSKKGLLDSMNPLANSIAESIPALAETEFLGLRRPLAERTEIDGESGILYTPGKIMLKVPAGKKRLEESILTKRELWYEIEDNPLELASFNDKSKPVKNHSYSKKNIANETVFGIVDFYVYADEGLLMQAGGTVKTAFVGESIPLLKRENYISLCNTEDPDYYEEREFSEDLLEQLNKRLGERIRNSRK
jgi:hypothetical protein